MTIVQAKLIIEQIKQCRVWCCKCGIYTGAVEYVIMPGDYNFVERTVSCHGSTETVNVSIFSDDTEFRFLFMMARVPAFREAARYFNTNVVSPERVIKPACPSGRPGRMFCFKEA